MKVQPSPTQTVKSEGSRSCPSSIRPCPSSTRPCPSSTRPCPSSTRPCPSSTRPCPSSTRPCPSSTRPCPSSTRPCPSSTRPCPSSTRSWPSSTRSCQSSTRARDQGESNQRPRHRPSQGDVRSCPYPLRSRLGTRQDPGQGSSSRPYPKRNRQETTTIQRQGRRSCRRNDRGALDGFVADDGRFTIQRSDSMEALNGDAHQRL